MNEIEEDVLELLDEAENIEDLVGAIELLNGKHQTAESHALVVAAGHMIGETLQSRKGEY